MASDLEDACGELLEMLAVAEGLIHQPDDDGTPGAGGFSSSPPWNGAVANVVLDAHRGVRVMEAQLREAVTGRWEVRGGSDAQTARTLRAAPAMAASLGSDAEREAARMVRGWLDAGRRLPAVDEAPVWRPLRPGPDGLPPQCPFCSTYNLRFQERSCIVQCFSPCCPGDGSGQVARAVMEIGAVSRQPIVVWSGGLVQYAPEPPKLEGAA